MARKKSRFIIMIIVGVGISMLLGLFSEPNRNTQQNLFFHYLTSILITVMVWEGNLRIDGYLDKSLPWDKKVGTRLALQFPLSMLYSAITIYVLMMLYNKYICNFPVEVQSAFSKMAFVIGLMVSVILLSIELGVRFFRNWKKSLVEIERYKNETLQAQLLNLKTQVNPHFLFNNLSVLTSLVYENQDKAADFISQLSKVYRYLLDNHESELVNLESELQFISSYCFLLQIRFENSIELKVDVDKSVYHKLVPPMALQLLVENATKHNEISADSPLQIRVYNQGAELCVENNIQVRTETHNGSGTGLSNIIKRYRYFTDEKLKITKSEHVFSVSIPLLSA